MADVETVEAARSRVAAAYNNWLKKSFGTIIGVIGDRVTRTALQERIGEDGAWLPKAQSKALAWIPMFSRNPAGELDVALPRVANPHLLGGSLNLSAQVQAVLIRVFPAYRDDHGRASVHPYWEWALVFVFPSVAAARAISSTSGNSVEFAPSTGALTIKARGRTTNERYVDAALFRLVPPDDEWSEELGITYDEATLALGRFLNVSVVGPPEEPIDEPEADDFETGDGDG